jgi:hypothetical protein
MLLHPTTGLLGNHDTHQPTLPSLSQVFAKALDKCEHECDDHTFAPSINPLSRQLALANYAVAPDPLRPWTKSPKHTRWVGPRKVKRHAALKNNMW